MQAHQPATIGHEQPLVLLADSHEDTLDMYAEYLRFNGYRVVTAAGSHECIDLARVHHPAAVVLSMRMPLMSGADAMRVMRADVTLSMTPIVALTTSVLESGRADALASGFDAVIMKPCYPNELKETVDGLVARVRSIAASSGS